MSPSHDPFGRSRPAHDPASQDEGGPRGKSAPRGREKVAASIAASSKKKLPKVKPSKLRIIGGDLRGRGVLYLGDRDTRPMKESLREALFNIVGPSIKGRIAWDLFSGTGILAIESFSRGADYAVAIERSRFFARTILKSAEAIGVTDEFLEVITGDAFRVSPGRMAEIAEQFPTIPWVVYFCPPYALWIEQQDDMFELLETTVKLAPPGSLIVTETDKFFDIESLPLGPWDVRPKGNMTLAFLETT